ncbi:aspartic peptidase domain-containing protein [Crepidotus variabilis]|uniref:Aspartic peptidase domain-containing protein n=1 Tax=Crepidotus variabilis TaxID=179855 RepID=A0A9P6JU41_9AGAR|nr:aspartic peptidase domain-containing protein [Crepidotus variabilis]
MRSLLPLSLLLSIFEAPVLAVIFDFKALVDRTPTSELSRRDPIPVSNTGNAQYVSNITIGGQTLRVLLDTGSSDLWVHFPSAGPSGAKDTGKAVSLSYAVGKAGGNVQTAEVKLANYTVADQAFLNVVDTSTFTSNIKAQGYDGLLGLGPSSGSVIRKNVGDDVAETLLQRIFEADKGTNNYISFTLDRKNDPTVDYTGQFSISEIIPPFNNITSMPKLDVDKVNRLLKADQHWQALTDEDNGIIGPDGQPITIDSIVPGAPKGQFVAVIDSGFTFSQVPRDVSDQIYGRVQGAAYDEVNQWWLVPCGQYLNISFNFGGVNYPIHPLDTVVDDNFAKTDSTGKKVCIGAFQPITSAFSLLGNYDMILGMCFLRNVYALLDFGNWIENSSDQEHPYIQMVPTTSVAEGRGDFIQVRLSGTDTISDSRWTLLPAAQMQHSPISAEEKKKKYQEMILSRWPYIFVGCLAFIILTTGFCIWKCCQRRRARRAGGLQNSSNRKGTLGFFGKNDDKVASRELNSPYGGGAKQESYLPVADHTQSTADLRNPFATPQSSQHNLSHPQAPYATDHQGRESQYSTHSENSGFSQYGGTQNGYDQGYSQHGGGYPPQQAYR